MRIEMAKERVILSQEETAVLLKAQNILNDMYDIVNSDILLNLLDEMQNNFNNLWGDNDEYNVVQSKGCNEGIKLTIQWQEIKNGDKINETRRFDRYYNLTVRAEV